MRDQNVLVYKTVLKSEQVEVIEAYYKIYELSLWKSDEALHPHFRFHTKHKLMYLMVTFHIFINEWFRQTSKRSRLACESCWAPEKRRNTLKTWSSLCRSGKCTDLM